MPIRGQCRLCLSTDVALQDSHIMPRFSYVRVRGDSPQDDPVFFRGGKAYQSQEQVKEHLLCFTCEQTFAKVEGRIAELLPLRDGKRAPILDLLGNAFETTANGTRAVELGRVRGEDLAYFSASVIWRGHVSDGFNVKLGDVYGEQFRRYLLGETDFPPKAACVATFFDLPYDDRIDVKASAVGVQTWPRNKNDRSHRHGFMVMGLQFFLQIGNQLDDWATASCLVRNKTMFLARQEHLVQWLGPTILSAKPTGRLTGRGPCSSG